MLKHILWGGEGGGGVGVSEQRWNCFKVGVKAQKQCPAWLQWVGQVEEGAVLSFPVFINNRS